MSNDAHSDAIKQVSANDAWHALSDNDNAVLVDVRSLPEWSFVGTPDLSTIQKEPLLLSWKKYPTMELNPQFCDELEATIANKNTPLYFLCKGGFRSQDAAEAMKQRGYTECHNIENGFEGEINAHSQRGSTNGWKAAQLPWRQT